MKTCFKCNKKKHLSEFYVHAAMADGRLNKCKDCTKQDVAAHRAKNIERIRAYDRKRGELEYRKERCRQYYKTENGKKSQSKSRIKWIKCNPEKRTAMNRLNNAVRCGKIEKEPCQIYGSKKRINGHHEDYSKPFDVIWLCHNCHCALHKKRRRKQSEA